MKKKMPRILVKPTFPDNPDDVMKCKALEDIYNHYLENLTEEEKDEIVRIELQIGKYCCKLVSHSQDFI